MSLIGNLSQGTDGYTVLNDKATIEHIMPQNLNNEWRKHLGAAADAIHRDYLNTIGNLTLVTQGKNSEASDGRFGDKREILATHALLLNREYFSNDISRWDADAIKARTEWLTGLILDVWPALGAPRRTVGGKGKTPLTLTILDFHIDLERFYGWRGMLMQMINFLHESHLLVDFDDAHREFSRFVELEMSKHQDSTASLLLAGGFMLI